MWLVALLLVGLAFGVEKGLEEGIKKLKKEGLLSEEMERMIEEYKEAGRKARKEALRKAKEWKVYQGKGGKVVVEKREEKGKGEEVVKRRVYIFMSSSVPKEVWEGYMDYVLKKNIPAVFLLRGCIGGCRYIRPTLEFIKEVLGERPLEIWIDPIKFRDYGVKVVPCVAMEGKEEVSCGDWNLEYHLSKLGAWSR